MPPWAAAMPTFEDETACFEQSLTEASDNEPLIAPERLNAALSHLRQEEREAIQLMVIEEMSASAVAQVVGKSRGTILSLVKRGKDKLRQHLRPAWQKRPTHESSPINRRQ